MLTNLHNKFYNVIVENVHIQNPSFIIYNKLKKEIQGRCDLKGKRNYTIYTITDTVNPLTKFQKNKRLCSPPLRWDLWQSDQTVQSLCHKTQDLCPRIWIFAPSSHRISECVTSLTKDPSLLIAQFSQTTSSWTSPGCATHLLCENHGCLSAPGNLQ